MVFKRILDWLVAPAGRFWALRRIRAAALTLAILAFAILVAMSVWLPLFVQARPALEPGESGDSPGKSSGRIPVILIHGLGGDAGAWEGGKQGGLPAALERKGYVRGKTLFILDYGPDNNGDYTEIYKRYLIPAIDRARGMSGQPRVDLVANSMGGLVARYYINSPDYRKDVRTLVMIASPARGSFAANLLKTVVTVDKLAGTATRVPDDSGGAEGFIAQRAFGFYLKLVRDWAIGGRFSRLPKSKKNHLAFEEWFASARSGDFQRLLIGGQVPFGGGDAPFVGSDGRPSQAGARAPEPEEALTGAFYEVLAIDVAKAAFRLRGHGNEWFVPSHLKGLGTRVKEFTARLPARGAAVIAGIAGIDPGGAALDRLLEEEIQFPVKKGPDGKPVYQRLRANYFLGSWNEWESRTRFSQGRSASFTGGDLPEAGVKYVVVAGAVPNVWAALPSVGPNDLVVEVDSSWLPLQENDSFRLFSGVGSSTSHLGLKNNPVVQNYILKHLEGYYPAVRRHSPLGERRWWRAASWSEDGQIEVTPWEPTYVEVDSTRLKENGGKLTVKVQAPKPDRPEDYHFWLNQYTRGGGLVQRVPIELTWKGRKLIGTASIEGFGPDYEKVLLGGRLTGADLRRWGEKPRKVSYSIEFIPGTPSRWKSAGRRPPETPVTPVETGFGPGGGDSFLNQGSVKRGGPPTVIVKSGSKQTTLKDEDRTFHERWEWDFGDGTSETDVNPDHTSGDMEHSFSAPGTYRVKASSYGNKGRVLREESWEVKVDKPGVLRFPFETVVEPTVKIRLEGPAKWVTGRPARFRVQVESNDPPFVERKVVTIDPGREFEVLWEKPGTYTVSAAVTMRVTYRFGEKSITAWNTHVRSVRVEVLTTGVTDE